MSLAILFLSTIIAYLLFILKLYDLCLLLLFFTFLANFIIQEKIKIIRFVFIFIILISLSFIFMPIISNEISIYIFIIEIIANISLMIEMLYILLKEKYEMMSVRQEALKYLPIYMFSNLKIGNDKKK